ncbi:MAG TPA: UDP-glucose:dolichyl-phosphate glucosyltransferase [Candidatus Omnitrophica bacterium]|nr:UDP-glucose:dolichyl-phosphate glucosyltransferase [Candidatus Omnitrophota bacterium]
MKNLDGKVSVIIPAYNEGRVIFDSLNETIRTFNDFGCDYEIILIDDGSKDNTLAQALKAAKECPRIKVKRNLVNYGKGRALKKAFRYTTGDYVVFLDADLDLHPAQAQTLFDILKLDSADVVIGSKMHPNSQVEYPFSRKVISFIYYLIIKILFGLPIHDTQTGLKLFKREVLKDVLPRIVVKKFALDLEILANIHRLGFKIAEAPIVLKQNRPFGRLGLKAMVQTGWDTLAIFYRMYILRYYDKTTVESMDISHSKARSAEES